MGSALELTLNFQVRGAAFELEREAMKRGFFIPLLKKRGFTTEFTENTEKEGRA